MINSEEDALLETILAEPALVQLIYSKKKELLKNFVHLFLQKDIKKIYFSGQASGTYIGNLLKPFIEQLLDIEVVVVNPSYFFEYEKFNNNGVYSANQLLMVCPAHSGTTKGPILMAKECQKQGISVVCTTYDVTSELAKYSDVVIDKHSGPEESFIETKGHIASLVILFLGFIEVAFKSKQISEREYETYSSFFVQLSDYLQKSINNTKKWYQKNKKMLLNADKARYIGRGPYYPVVQEGGLKIAEATNISALVYEAEEFMHTGTTQIGTNSLIFITAPLSGNVERMGKLIEWCREYSEQVIMIANSSHPLVDEHSLISDFSDNEYLGVIEYLVCFQLIACLCAKDKQVSIIHARNDGANKKLQTHVEG